MGILRFVLWTTLCIGLGIFLGTYEIGGKTPWQSARGLWKQSAPRLEKVKDSAEDLVVDVKKKVSPQAETPKERHSKDERDAIDQLISKRSKG
jgi:hypothetical protein